MSIESSTLKGYINDYKHQSLKMTDFFLFEWLNDPSRSDFYIKTIEENILAKHTDFLNLNKEAKTFTDDEFRMYRCNAHRFAQDTYGTTELWFLVLHANEMHSESEFCTKNIYYYTPEVLEKLNELLAVENDDVIKNRNTISITEALLKKQKG